ncbi:SIS domain-containing protein [Subtercola lobariae]|uniref:SIS domain-containing protein n=1 Tax=Subtercola lobariae TaxID=1588641 RepID=A0A917AZC3_9MICO|nr:sugar isomerase [Subtercola lobariae]GGF10431.1 hypothetical protein GCM10011399_00360 [Subtercola lobariae]
MTEFFVDAELASQPHVWLTAAGMLSDVAHLLPARGERTAIIGCGTSWFVGMSYAGFREQAGHGETDAFAGSEFPVGRDYDAYILLSRSGTTTEILDLLDVLPADKTVVITAVPDSPLAMGSSRVIALPFADERSVVQTRFATTALALLRAHLGHDIADLAAEAELALSIPIHELLAAEQVSFVGLGPAVGLATEAALKCREAAQFWAESYPAMDYRHGPVAIAQPGRLVWCLGDAPEGFADEIDHTGATFVRHGLDPIAGLIVAQRFAVALAVQRGLDPDHPRALTRSVILSS